MVDHTYIKQIFLNALFLFSCLSLSGHVIINFCERWRMQNELISMKRNLYLLTESITNLKNQYDNFESELSGVLNTVDNKQSKSHAHLSDKLKQEVYRYIV